MSKYLLSLRGMGRTLFFAMGANLFWASSAFAGTTLESPLDKDLNFRQLINVLINWILIFIGFVAVLYLIWSGFKYVTAGGDSKKAGEAKDAIVHAIIGIAIAMISVILVQFIYKDVLNVDENIQKEVFSQVESGSDSFA